MTDAIRIRIQQDGWNEAILTNTIGQVLDRIPLVSGENALHVAQLPAGIYYLQIKGKGGSHTEKVERL